MDINAPGNLFPPEQFTLSVLIATMPKRNMDLAVLLTALTSQMRDSEYFQICIDGSMDYNIGIKRNKLLQQAKGKYIVFVDDDDAVAPNYISLILKACASGADCIGINGIMTTNGKDKRRWFISKEYGHWYEKNRIYYRTPNHISPVKRELALQAGFPEIKFGEDAEYSRRLLPLLKTEVIIKEPIYHYDYWKK